MADRPPETNEIELPMSRREIAGHLGMTIETVSRTFAKFEAIKAIARSDARQLKLRSRAALERISTSRVMPQNQLGARRHPNAAVGTRRTSAMV
jgi:Crp-like helix-turn-helix domain